MTSRQTSLDDSSVAKKAVKSSRHNRFTTQIWVEVLAELEANDLLNLDRVTCWLSNMASDNSLWQRFCADEAVKVPPLPPASIDTGTLKCHHTAGYFKRLYLQELNTRSNLLALRATGHEASLGKGYTARCLLFTSKYAIAVCAPGLIKVCTLPDLMPHAEIKTPITKSTMVVADGNCLLAASDRTIAMWDIDTAKPCGEFRRHTRAVTCIELRNNKVVSSCDVLTVCKWNFGTNEAELEIRSTDITVSCIDFNSEKIVAGSYEGNVVVWNSISGELLYSVYVNYGYVGKVQICGAYLTAMGPCGRFGLLKTETGDIEKLFYMPGYKEICLPENFLNPRSADGSLELKEMNKRKEMLSNICLMDAAFVMVRKGVLITMDGREGVSTFKLLKDYSIIRSAYFNIGGNSTYSFNCDGSKILYSACAVDYNDTVCLLDFEC